MKLNWFSPLPPARTGIADYTAFLLPELCRQFELVLWTDQDRWDPALERLAPVRRFDDARPDFSQLNRADMNVYHIGNSPSHHAAIWRMSRKMPGVVEIHDISLQHFFGGVFREIASDRAGYLAAMERFYGRSGREAAERFWAGEHNSEFMGHHWPLTHLAVEGALGVMVHHPDALEQLKLPRECPAVYAPLPRAMMQRPADHRVSYTAPLDDGRFNLIIFGHIGPNRRLEAFLEAWSGLPARDRFFLNICGEIWEPRRITSLISKLGLDEQVQMHGYVSDAVLCDLLERSHLAINLRYPTMGEASGSLLFMWEFSLPALVTRVGWYATLPPEAVGFVDPEDEIADVRRHLTEFLADPPRYAAMGEFGYRQLQTVHSPRAYVEAMAKLTTAAKDARLWQAARELAERTGQELGNWATEISPPAGFSSIAEEIAELFMAGARPSTGVGQLTADEET